MILCLILCHEHLRIWVPSLVSVNKTAQVPKPHIQSLNCLCVNHDDIILSTTPLTVSGQEAGGNSRVLRSEKGAYNAIQLPPLCDKSSAVRFSSASFLACASPWKQHRHPWAKRKKVERQVTNDLICWGHWCRDCALASFYRTQRIVSLWDLLFFLHAPFSFSCSVSWGQHTDPKDRDRAP